MRTLKEQLVEKGLADTRINKSGTKIRRSGTNNRKSVQKERLSERDLAELMGSNRPTYGRARGGAFRQR